MTSKRRVGKEQSATRAAIIKTTEQLLLQEGYGAVSTRRVARELGLTAPLIHYYFPSTDDLLVAVYQYAAEQTLARYAAALVSKQPLRALWQVCIDPTRTTLALEFMALASHRKAVQVEISRFSEELRLDLPRFGGRVVESIYSRVLMLLLRMALGFSVAGFLSLGDSSAVCRVSGRSFAVC